MAFRTAYLPSTGSLAAESGPRSFTPGVVEREWAVLLSSSVHDLLARYVPAYGQKGDDSDAA